MEINKEKMDYREIRQGDLVDFGPNYGKFYVCDPDYSNDYFWVTDDKYERNNERAQGWSILKDMAVKIIESQYDDEDIDECIHTEDGIICHDCFKLLYAIDDFLHAILIEAPDVETAKSLLLMRCDRIQSILGVGAATDEDRVNGIPLLKESTPIEEAEEYIVQYKIDPLSFNLTNRIDADGERDAKKRFSRLRPEAKIQDVQRAKPVDKIYPKVS